MGLLPLPGFVAGRRRRRVEGEASGTFWLFWRLMKALIEEKREPSLIVLETYAAP
jgi:hypothetical protein